MAADFLTGIKGLWRLDETVGAPSATDSTGNGNTGTPSGSPVFGAAGQIGNALTLVSASSQFLDCGTAVLTGAKTSFTIASWVKRATAASNVSVTFSTSSLNSCGFDVFGDGNVYFDCGASNQTRFGASAGTAWHHYCNVYDGSLGGVGTENLRCTPYIDGVAQNGFSTNGTIQTSITLTGTHFFIGKRTDASPLYSDGLVDDVRVYDRALTAADVVGLAAYTGPAASTSVITGKSGSAWNGGSGTASLTFTAQASEIVQLSSISTSVDNTWPGRSLKAESPVGTTIFEVSLPSAIVREFPFPSGLSGAVGQSVKVTVDGGLTNGLVSATRR